MAIWNRFKKKAEAPEKASLAKQLTQTTGTTEKAPKASVSPKPKVAKAKRAVTSVSKLATATLLAPVVTEKTAQLSDAGRVIFWVPLEANRITVRQAFRELYKVTPVKINMARVRGKHVRFGLTQGARQNRKKAIITLPKGTRIDIFEGV